MMLVPEVVLVSTSTAIIQKNPNKQANREKKGVQHTSHQQQAIIQAEIQVVWKQAEPDPIN